MKEVFLGLGGNIGPSIEIVSKAVDKISNLPIVYDLEVSVLYETSPVSDVKQNNFINLVCKLKTNLEDPFLFFKYLEGIEKELGKVPKPKNAPRVIDIDILLYGNLYVNEPHLQIPHPRMLERLFVLEPLSFFQNEIIFPISQLDFQTLNIQDCIYKIKKQDHQISQMVKKHVFKI